MNAALHASAAVVVRRTIAASPEVLFDAFLDPYALAEWMRPGTIRSTVATVEARVGGRGNGPAHDDGGAGMEGCVHERFLCCFVTYFSSAARRPSQKRR